MSSKSQNHGDNDDQDQDNNGPDDNLNLCVLLVALFAGDDFLVEIRSASVLRAQAFLDDGLV